MKKDNRINPIGLKGNQINERMKELMGIKPINENKTTSVIELTKIGPDGNAYAIVRENHEYYIKSTNKSENLLSEDFKYIGGLQNKKSEAYPSYAKAIKHLKLKFNSLSESYNTGSNINVFENDNLVNEAGVAGFSTQRGSGFSGEGNLHGNTPLPIAEDDKSKNNPWAICTASVGRDDKEKYESCVKDVKKEYGIDEDMSENEYCGEELIDEEVKLTEEEKAVDDMMEEEVDENWGSKKDEYKREKGEKTGDVDGHYKDYEKNEDKKSVNETHKLSILRALENMDAIIDSLSEGKVKKKVYRLK